MLEDQREHLPKHIAIIMDGNGRWAKKRRLPRVAGHRKGVERVREITKACGNMGIKALTLYAFSDENWRRPEEEVGALMGLLRFYLRAEAKEIVQNNVQFRMIGDRAKISNDIMELVSDLEKRTENNTGMFLNIALSYGSHSEILRATKRLVKKCQEEGLYLEDIDKEAFESCLDTHELPDVDMLIRTSGEKRVSNFLLWQVAYAEFFFDPTYWPDFTEAHLGKLIEEFCHRERRFGLTPEQASLKRSNP